MKLIHLSDLHIGKRVYQYPMLEDQKHILMEILNVVDREKPDGILIAGDIYDKSVPSTEAIQLFDDFLVRLSQRKLPVFIISGNHDSPERLSFGSRLIDVSGIHIAPVYNGKVTPFPMEDVFGSVNVYMLPFVKPANVRRFFEEEKIETYTDAVRVAIKNMNVDTTKRNVLVTHQFVTGALRSESEEVSVGGADNVDASVFDGFDYVALGHIHGPQNVVSERIRYCGTPLKYSFSEANHQKSVTVVEIGKKEDLKIQEIPLIPKRDMVEIKGTYDELTLKANYENTTYREDYTHITLTDEEDIFGAFAKLRTIYHNLMHLSYDNRRTRHRAEIGTLEDVENKSPYDLFWEFYEKQNGMPMTEEQSTFIKKLMEDVRGEIESCDR